MEDDQHVQYHVVFVFLLVLQDGCELSQENYDILHELYQHFRLVLMNFLIGNELSQHVPRFIFECLDFRLMVVNQPVVVLFLELPFDHDLAGIDYGIFQTTAHAFHFNGGISEIFVDYLPGVDFEGAVSFAGFHTQYLANFEYLLPLFTPYSIEFVNLQPAGHIRI